MPVHFEAYVSSEEKEKALLAETMNIINNVDAVYATEDNTKLLLSKFLRDKNDNNKRIGKIVITILVNKEEKEHEIVDIDVTLDSKEKCTLFFETILKESSVANEYYNVTYGGENGVHFQIETVDRHMVKEAGLMNCEVDVNLSLFPFRMNAFDTLEELNEAIGFKKPVDIEGVQSAVNGLAEDFMGVGGMLLGVDETCSVLIGKVESFKEVRCDYGNQEIEFTEIFIKTAVGVLPVAASRDNFDLSNLKVGSYIMMFADVKADFKQ